MSASTNQSDKQRATPVLRVRGTASGTWRAMAFSLRVKVLLAFVVVALVPLVILALFNYVATRQTLTHSANQALFAAASQTAARLDASITAELAMIGEEGRLLTLAEYLGSFPDRRETEAAKTRVLEILRGFSRKDAVFISSYALLDLKGRSVIDTDDSAVGGDESAREYFQVALETGLPYVSSVEFESGNGKAYLYFSSVVVNRATGKPVGVLRARYSAAILQQWLFQDGGLAGSQSYPLLLADSGLILADGLSSPGSASSLRYQLAMPLSSERAAELVAVRQLPPGNVLAVQAPGLAGSLVTVDSPDPYFTVHRSAAGTGPEAAAVARMKTLPWLVASLEPQDALLAPARAQARNAAVLAALLVLIVAMVAIGAARLLTDPIVRLTAVARHVAGGNLNARAEIESNDEIGILAQAFNSMTSQLNASIVSLEQRVTELDLASSALRLSSERLQLATRVANIGIWDWDIPRNELVWDDSMYQLYGLQKGDFGGAYDAWIRTIHPEDKAHTDGEIQAALRGEREYAPEFRIVRPDGAIRHIKADSRTIKNAEGKPLRMIGTNIDITELKQAEMSIRTLNQELGRRVAERTEQLETAVYDLENFNYSASHDLRIPLRAVDGFSRILLDEYSRKLDAEGVRLLHVVRDNARKMAQYIEDMQAFTTIGRMAVLPAGINMDALVHEVVEELMPATAGREIELEIKSLPPIIADRSMLRWVMVNLLANALKFTRPKSSALIEIGAKTDHGETVYYVKDNGVGFDMQYADKLFGVFQRLHGVKEFEGTGIGLAIVKRIIARHGGRVWVESRVNEGATFYFSLPHDGIS